MRFLVLGGGGFLGHHAVAAARDAGHAVTVFGRSESSPFADVEVLVGDRNGDLSALDGREWDAAFDTFTGVDAVRATATTLSGRVGAYGYVSGMSVYAPSGPAWPDESAPLRRAGVEPDDDPLQERSLAKLGAESALHELFDGPVLVPRVGIMVGPRDPSHRFTYWPHRVADAVSGRRDRRVLVPGALDRTVQYSDARDIAAWTVGMLARGSGGTYNTVGPGRPDTLRDVLTGCLAAAGGGDVEWVSVAQDVVRDGLRDVEEETRPLWYPEDQIPQAGIDASAASAAGLRFRPIVDTARDVLAEDSPLDTDDFAARERELRERAAG